MLKKLLKQLKLSHKLALGGLLIVGTVLQASTMFRSGPFYSFGVGFWGPNGHDGIWHLALANQVLKDFPPPDPIFSGFSLSNYHYFYDLLLSVTHGLTLIPITYLYFQIFPFLMALAIGTLSFLFGYLWRKDFWFGFWLAFFNFFGGSFGYLVTLWRDKQLGGESLFWSMQSISTLINPPFALSLIIILVGMLFLLKMKDWTLKKIIWVGILFGILINVKAYGGVVVLIALGMFALIKLSRKERAYLGIFGVALLVSGIIFISINREAASLFVWQPFWFINSMIEAQDRLYLSRLALARYSSMDQGLGPKLIAIELFGLVVFLIGNLGTRIIGIFDLIKRSKKLDEFDVFILAGGLVGLIIPLFFVQKGTAWNAIQFLYYFLFFANFYAASLLSRVMTFKKPLRLLLITLVVLLTAPTTISTIKNYIGWPPPAAVFKVEMEGLKFLEQQPGGVVLTYPYDKTKKTRYKSTPVPLSAYESTAYVSAFSDKLTFLADEMNLEIMGRNGSLRREEEIKFFTGNDINWARDFLSKNQIRYIYLVKDENLTLGGSILGIKEIFTNDEVRIYQVL